MILFFYLDNIMYLSLETIMFEPQNDKTSSKYFNAATYSEFDKTSSKYFNAATYSEFELKILS